MTIAAILGVKDEVELVARALAHLRQLGVEQIIVSDYGSTDGTIEVLAEERRRGGDVVITHVGEGEISDYGTWSARELALAESTDADWVIFLDADEFWIPASGSLLETCQTVEADVVMCERYNVVVTSEGTRMPEIIRPENHAELLLYARRPDHFRKFVDDNPKIPFISLMPGPKVMVRPKAVACLAPGHHDVVAPERVRKVRAADLLVAHVAFSSVERFARKVDNVRAELASHPDYFIGDLAWHWRRWTALDGTGVEQEFARQVVDHDTLVNLRSEGVVRSAAEILGRPHVYRADCLTGA